MVGSRERVKTQTPQHVVYTSKTERGENDSETCISHISHEESYQRFGKTNSVNVEGFKGSWRLTQNTGPRVRPTVLDSSKNDTTSVPSGRIKSKTPHLGFGMHGGSGNVQQEHVGRNKVRTTGSNSRYLRLAVPPISCRRQGIAVLSRTNVPGSRRSSW